MKLNSMSLLCIALTALSMPVRAIELSLEENRAERGSVGFVDMQRLFKASPDATRARDGLEELVRQAEERVNAKKAELLRLRQTFGTLKQEREDLSHSTPTVSVPVQPVAEPAASTQAAPAPLTINLPGLTEGPLNLERPGSSPLNPTRDRGISKPEPIAIPVAVPTPVAAPTIAAPAVAAPVAPSGPTLAQRLLELDGRIVAAQGEIDRQQGELDRERLGAERSLLDAEGRKTDQVLARLYRAIAEVAKHEGVSVVVEKSATLYGHPAVDLTEKILKQLRGAAPAQ